MITQLKNTILQKSYIVHKQNMMEIESSIDTSKIWHEIDEKLMIHYIKRIASTIEKFFSENQKLQEEGIKGYKGLLHLRQWDDIDDTFSKNNENKDKFKHRFVDDFNNFSEFYEFLESLVKDVEEYHKLRIEKMKD